MPSVKFAFDRQSVYEFLNLTKNFSENIPGAASVWVNEFARLSLQNAVKNFPVRTGNLRSSAKSVWKNLGLPGSAMTVVPEGEKTLTYIQRGTGKRKVVRALSKGVYVDRRKDSSPSYQYALTAAEWRKRQGKIGRGKLRDVLRRNLLSGEEKREVQLMLNNGVNFNLVWAFVESALAKTQSGSRFIVRSGGFWKVYSLYFRGNRATTREEAVRRARKKMIKDLKKERSAA